MALSEQDVRHVALLARLGLSGEQVVELQGELNSILEHIDQLRNLDLEGVEPTTHAVPLVNAMRADEPRPSLSHEAALMNAPQQRDGAFLIPRIVGPGGGA
ncbi:MAG: Asp-tRNA(Asn)/Glu-tRNA(Gln) amidotransferase subunit GatC [Actinomycetes bacterium]|jgi:aspartyl-tRNA(Asn)/glutamyl-tRNA(Gln) amidotransferase subunit C|nr:Asp-tRNA(Asn)/Glu-tRNA(Gln) amidotransferase subunit GatC [Actinomycetes bacterium]